MADIISGINIPDSKIAREAAELVRQYETEMLLGAPASQCPDLSSSPEDFHLRALPDPYVNLSIHTAPIVRPLPWHNDQWAKSFGFARRNRSNQSLAPLV